MDPIIDITFANELIRFGSYVGWPGSDCNSSKPSALDLAKTGFYYKGQSDEVSCFSCGLSVKDWERHHDPIVVHATRSPHCPMVVGRGSENYPVVVPDERERRAILNMLQQAGKRVLSTVSGTAYNSPSLLANTLTALYGESMMRKRPAPAQPRPLNRSLSLSPRLTQPTSRQLVRPAPVPPVGRVAPPSRQVVSTGPPHHQAPQRRSSESEFDSSGGGGATAPARPAFHRARSYAPTNHLPVSTKTIANRQSSSSNVDHLEYQESEAARLKTFERWSGIKGASAKEFAQAGFIFIGAPDRVQCVFCNGILRNWNDNDKPIEEHRKHFPTCSHVVESLSAITTSQPRHEEYSTLESREKSFEKWSRNTTSTPVPQELARAGFYYVGHGDSVKCFYCDGGLRNWEPNDDPWREHARWFPKCDYVRQSKGKPYIDAVLHETKRTDYQTASVDQTEVKNVAGASGHGREVDPREVTSRMDSAIVKAVLKMEIPKERVRKAIKKRLADQGEDFTSAEALLEAVFNLDPSDPSGENTDPRELSDTVNQEEGGPKSNSSDQGMESIQLIEENRQLKEQKQCKICMDEEVCVVFLPCGHLVCCSTCAPALDTCPICRAKIRGTVRTYLA